VRAACGASVGVLSDGAQARGAPPVREPKAQKHILTAYNRDNQMLMRRKKARAGGAVHPGVA